MRESDKMLKVLDESDEAEHIGSELVKRRKEIVLLNDELALLGKQALRLKDEVMTMRSKVAYEIEKERACARDEITKQKNELNVLIDGSRSQIAKNKADAENNRQDRIQIDEALRQNSEKQKLLDKSNEDLKKLIAENKSKSEELALLISKYQTLKDEQETVKANNDARSKELSLGESRITETLRAISKKETDIDAKLKENKVVMENNQQILLQIQEEKSTLEEKHVEIAAENDALTIKRKNLNDKEINLRDFKRILDEEWEKVQKYQDKK